MKTLTEAWEEAGRPRPPFKYLFDHPDAWREQWNAVYRVGMVEFDTYFDDDMNSGMFNGKLITVRKLDLMGNK